MDYREEKHFQNQRNIRVALFKGISMMFKNGIASVSVNSQQANIAETFSPVWAFKKSYRAKRQGKVILAEQF